MANLFPHLLRHQYLLAHYRTRKKSQQLHFDWRKIGQNLFVVVFEIINDSMFRLPFLSFSPSHHRHRHNPMKINDVNAYAQVRIRYWMAHKNRPIDCYSSKMFHPPNGKQFVVFIVFKWASLCEKNTTNKPYHWVYSNCDGVILPKLEKLKLNIAGKEQEFCPRCECKYENRNTTIIKVVVIIVIWVISLLVVYMLFLICLDPLLNKRIKNSYQEHTNEDVCSTN